MHTPPLIHDHAINNGGGANDDYQMSSCIPPQVRIYHHKSSSHSQLARPMMNMASMHRVNAPNDSSSYMPSLKAPGMRKKMHKLMHHKNVTLQSSASNPLYSCIIGGGVVQSLAKGIITSCDDRFATNNMLQQEFKLNRSHSLAEISKNFDQIKYPPDQRS